MLKRFKVLHNLLTTEAVRSSRHQQRVLQEAEILPENGKLRSVLFRTVNPRLEHDNHLESKLQ